MHLYNNVKGKNTPIHVKVLHLKMPLNHYHKSTKQNALKVSKVKLLNRKIPTGTDIMYDIIVYTDAPVCKQHFTFA